MTHKQGEATCATWRHNARKDWNEHDFPSTHEAPYYGDEVIQLVSADITKVGADVVVLSANPRLIRGGGVSGAIHKAAGPKLEAAAQAMGPIEPGSAVMTEAFNLDARKIIHAVAPIFSNSDTNIDEIFSRTYRSIFDLNRTKAGEQSIVFPAIGAGIYGWPCTRAAKLAVDALRASSYLKTLVAVIDEENYKAYESALSEQTGVS